MCRALPVPAQPASDENLGKTAWKSIFPQGFGVPQRDTQMSPTVFRDKGYRFFFFSREELRMHVHVMSGDGEAKFWLEPAILLATSHRYTDTQ